MNKHFLLLVCIALCGTLAAQQLSGPPSGDNQKARVTQWIGPVEVTIDYSSPDVHDAQGRDRAGKIWGTNVAHYGFVDQGFGAGLPAPWRAGANEKGNKAKAMEVFQYNFKAHPEEKFTPTVGLARGYSAMGDKKNAIKYWELAIKNIPENQKAFYTPMFEEELKKAKSM